MKASIALAVSLQALVLALTPADAKEIKDPKYRVLEIPRPQADVDGCAPGYAYAVYARRMNEDAHAAGYSDCWVATGDQAASFLPRGLRGFTWSESYGSLALPTLTQSPLQSVPRSMNASGDVVGYETDTAGRTSAVAWLATGVVWQPFREDPSCSIQTSFAEGINDSGTIAGAAVRLRSSTATCSLAWVLQDDTGTEYLGPQPGRPRAINRAGVTVGTFGVHAALWSGGTDISILHQVTQPGGANFAAAAAWNLNESGDAVGHSFIFDPDGCPVSGDAYLWRADGTEIVLEAADGLPYSLAYDVNDDLEVVGYSQAAGCTSFLVPAGSSPVAMQARLWKDGKGYDLNDLIAKQDGIELIVATSINDRGEILAHGYLLAEPPSPCPDYVVDPATGAIAYDAALTCRSQHSFLLVPKHDGKDK